MATPTPYFQYAAEAYAKGVADAVDEQMGNAAGTLWSKLAPLFPVIVLKQWRIATAKGTITYPKPGVGTYTDEPTVMLNFFRDMTGPPGRMVTKDVQPDIGVGEYCPDVWKGEIDKCSAALGAGAHIGEILFNISKNPNPGTPPAGWQPPTQAQVEQALQVWTAAAVAYREGSGCCQIL